MALKILEQYGAKTTMISDDLIAETEEDTEKVKGVWERQGCMSIVQFGKLRQSNPDNEFRVKYKGRLVKVGWIGFFYKAVADPQLFVTLFEVGKGTMGQGDCVVVAKVDKMIPSIFVSTRLVTASSGADILPIRPVTQRRIDGVIRRTDRLEERVKRLEGIHDTDHKAITLELSEDDLGYLKCAVKEQLNISISAALQALPHRVQMWRNLFDILEGV